MQETLLDHHTSISAGGRRICNRGFADDIDLMGGSMVNIKTSPTDSYTEQRHMEGESAQKEQDRDQQHEQHQCRY